MDLVGQGNRAAAPENRAGSGLDAGGFTMVVLLVVMAVMAIGTAALLPTWRQQAIRENEEELIFRGNQYARAVVLYARKNNNMLPADIDVLYTGKFLRKKYKDPITQEPFGLLAAGQPPGSAGRGVLGNGRASAAGSGRGQVVIGSIQGVYSTSSDTSIRVYQNQQRYIDWPFTFQTAQLRMGQVTGRGLTPGDGLRSGNPARGGPPTGPGRGGIQVPPGGRGGGIQIPPGGGRTGGGQPPPIGRGGRGGV
ncbi:MAG TPA: hypothetical protein VMZ90_14550 [Vicinamibacterales bacterium]|nr:hypothetical protein [Vicinamibacterales bacterium]